MENGTRVNTDEMCYENRKIGKSKTATTHSLNLTGARERNHTTLLKITAPQIPVHRIPMKASKVQTVVINAQTLAFSTEKPTSPAEVEG